MIAQALELPDNFDPDTDEFHEVLQNPVANGAPWQSLPVEAHSVAHLIAAANASIRNNAVIQFC